MLLYEATGKVTYKTGIQNFLREYSSQGSVKYTPGGLAWRAKWGSLRYTGKLTYQTYAATYKYMYIHLFTFPYYYVSCVLLNKYVVAVVATDDVVAFY